MFRGEPISFTYWSLHNTTMHIHRQVATSNKQNHQVNSKLPKWRCHNDATILRPTCGFNLGIFAITLKWFIVLSLLIQLSENCCGAENHYLKTSNYAHIHSAHNKTEIFILISEWKIPIAIFSIIRARMKEQF